MSKNKKWSAVSKNKKTKKTSTEENIENGKNIYPTYFLLILLLFISIYAIFSNNIWHIQDDTFISLRYVRNLISGNGLVFNPNEKVEGYTNFLWVIILSGASFLQFDPIEASQYLSFISGIIVIIFLYMTSLIMLKKSEPSATNKLVKFFCFLPVFLIVFSGSFVYWAVSGMESTLFMALIIGGIYFYFKFNSSPEKQTGINYATSVFLALASLTRPEGIFIGLLFFAHRIIYPAIRYKENIIGKPFFIEFGVFIIPVFCHFLFRYLYYGYLLPNTFYAKTNFDMISLKAGFNYLFSFIKEYLLYGVVVIIIIFSVRNKKIFFEVTLLLLILIVYSIYVVFIGGDVLAQHRFWLPVLPIIYILFTYALIGINNLTKGRYIIFILLFAIGTGYFNYINNRDEIHRITEREISLVNRMKITAETLNELGRIRNRRLTIATSTIGAISYYADADVIDMLGLTDSYIAHNPQFIEQISNDPTNPWKEKRFNANYVLKRNPDYILFATEVKPSSYAERALFATNEFFQNYFVWFIPRPHEKMLFFFARKNAYQMSLNKPGILSEKIDPEFVKQYITLFQISNAFKTSPDKSDLNSVTNELNKTEALRPSFFSDHYRVYGDVMATIGNFATARELYNKAISTDSMNTLSYFAMTLTFDAKKDGALLEKYMNELEKHLSL
jgi:arabinofuranosyltransferase